MNYYIATTDTKPYLQVNSYAQAGWDWAQSVGYVVLATFAGVAIIKFLIDSLKSS